MESHNKVSGDTLNQLSDMAHKLRIHSINMTDASKSG